MRITFSEDIYCPNGAYFPTDALQADDKTLIYATCPDLFGIHPRFYLME